MSDEELFNRLAKVYIERELLINKISDGEKVSLSEAQRKVEELIKDEHLLKLLGMLDRFFLIKGKDSIRIVRAYRYRLNQFVDRTIGHEQYALLLTSSKADLEETLAKDVRELLGNRDLFPLLEAQVKILLRWFKR
jgi:hypothetical protein